MKRITVFLAMMLVFGVLGEVNAAEQTEPTDLLQLTAAGHVLGFEAEGIYVASGDHMLRVEFAGTSGVAPVADRKLSGDGKAQPLGRVTYPDLWPGITLSYDHVGGGIVESTYQLEKGADVGQIKLRYNAPLEIEAGGSLLIKYETGQMSESAPVAWQDINGHRIPVEVAFCLFDSPVCNPVVGFTLGQYNPAYTLMIDPTLEWNTFMGGDCHGIAVDGSGYVYVAGSGFVAKLHSSGSLVWKTSIDATSFGIAVDGSGNVYVAGFSYYTWGSPVNTLPGNAHVFVAKLDSSGSLVWNTFMGSYLWDDCFGIAVDGNGNVYVAGYSNYTWGSPVNAYAGDSDAFVAKLDSSGSLVWNTFMGSFLSDQCYGIAVDGSGNVYVAGYSSNTWGSPVNAFAGDDWDAFVAKLDSSGSLVWNTFMGSAEYYDYGDGIAVDGSGNVYVTGGSLATWGLPVNAFGDGPLDAFVAKLDSSGSLVWNTFMGGRNNDSGDAIAVDGSGNVYVAGDSYARWGTPDPYAGLNDAFAAKLDSSGSFVWNIFMGSYSARPEYGHAIALERSGNVYVAGTSEATWGWPLYYADGIFGFVAKVLPLVAPDEDNDGLPYSEEFSKKTNPNDIDTDGDGFYDGEDLKPLNPDTNMDGVIDH